MIAAAEQFTPRQREVYGMVVEGLSYDEIAETLGISPYTLDHHLRGIVFVVRNGQRYPTAQTRRYEILRWHLEQCGFVPDVGGDLVYFVLAPSVDLVKIGVSNDPFRRLHTMKPLSPVPLELIGCIEGGAKREAELHEELALYRERDEWFRFEGKVEAVMDELFA